MARRLLALVTACASALALLVAVGLRADQPTAQGATSPAAHASTARPVWLWLAPWDNDGALASAVSHAGLVGQASPFWYELVGDRSVTTDAPADAGAIVARLRAKRIAVIPSVTESDGMAAFATLMERPADRDAAVQALVGLARRPGFSGLDLDFESFALDPRHDRSLAGRAGGLFAGFVGQICRALHRAGRSCYVTVMPRTNDSHTFLQEGLAKWVFDYTALSAVSDGVQVMAYDEHNTVTSPGPVAGLPWVRRVAAYALAHMPPDRTQLGLAAYGYTWGSNGTAFSLADRQADAYAAGAGATPQWSGAQAEETFSYRGGRVRYTTWFEDPRAEAIRASLAQTSGFAGIAVWAASDESPMLWPRLARVYGHR